jgi:predicted CXXCH cytochrome family protein
VKCLISYLTRKSRGGVARKDETIDADVLRLGRGADCNVHLADQRVLLNHAQIVARPGGFIVEGVGQGEIALNGKLTQTGHLAPGDKLTLGPYDIEVQAPADGYEFALTVELTHPLGDDLAQLKLRSGTSLKAVGLGKRGWSWVLAAIVLVLFLALPVIAHFGHPAPDKATLMKNASPNWPMNADIAWKAGEISGPHKPFGDNCSACHRSAFERVQNEACLTCHNEVHQHADVAKFQFATFAGARCESCHQEHNGNQTIVLRDQGFCVSCHGNLKSRSPAVTVGNVTDFGTDHPEFRPAVMQDAATAKFVRVALDASPKPEERSGLRFPHDKHLKPEGIRNPDKGLVKLDCGNCHVPDRGGISFEPIRMTETCQGCHALRFDAKALDRELPHGKPAEAQKVIRDYFAGLALRGEVQDDAAPSIVRRRPGEALPEAQRQEALAWAQSKAEEVSDLVVGKTLCATCHTLAKGGDGLWQVAPVKLADHWLPDARFVHNKHAVVGCDTCHATARKSETATDVLLPGVKTCQSCHGGERAADKVPSTCITCHTFHRPSMTPFGVQKSADAKQ